MRVLFLADLESEWDWIHVLYNRFSEAIDPQIEVKVFKQGAPLEGQFENIDVVVDCGSYGGETDLIEAANRAGVRLWQSLSNGLDHVDLETFRRLKLPLANTPGEYSGVALAEHAMYLILCFAKHFSEHRTTIANRTMCDPVCHELSGATLGIVGLGASGRELAKRAAAFGMSILAVEPGEIDQESLKQWGVEKVVKPDQLNEILPEIDYLSIHTPLNEQTRHLIDRKILHRMKPSSVIINVARGPIIDEEALYEVLKEGGIRGAGLDVFSTEPVDPGHPLLTLKNVLATPHIAGVTSGTAQRRAETAVRNIRRLERGEPVRHLVVQG